MTENEKQQVWNVLCAEYQNLPQSKSERVKRIWFNMDWTIILGSSLAAAISAGKWHDLYHNGLGGNGDADDLMDQVDELPIMLE